MPTSFLTASSTLFILTWPSEGLRKSKRDSLAWSGTLDEDDPHAIRHLVCEAHWSINKGSTLLPNKTEIRDCYIHYNKAQHNDVVVKRLHNSSQCFSLWVKPTICECVSSVSIHLFSVWVKKDSHEKRCGSGKICCDTNTPLQTLTLDFTAESFPEASSSTTVVQWQENKLTGLMVFTLQRALIHLSYCRSSVNSPVTGRLILMWHLKQKGCCSFLPCDEVSLDIICLEH